MNRRNSWGRGIALVSIVFAFATGCRQHSGRSGDPSTESAGFTLHRVHGTLLGKSAVTRQVTIRQDVIHNFMPATSVVYQIENPILLERLQPGDEITADATIPTDGSNGRLDNLVVTAEPRDPVSPAILPPHLLLIGEQVPDFPLVNENGRIVHFAQFHGQAVLITFMDTQCTDDCPVITGRFRRVNELLSKNPDAFGASHLISVSIDPANDTPSVLRRYGLQYLHEGASGFSHWGFAVPTPENLRRMAAAFGVLYTPSQGDIDHTMVTALIGPNDTLVRTWGGDDWDPDVIAKAVESAASTRGSF